MEDRQPAPRRYPPLRRVDGTGARLATVGRRQEPANSALGADLDAGDWPASQNDAKPQRMSKEQVAALMIGVTALGELTPEDALRIVNYMTPKRLRAGTVPVSYTHLTLPTILRV